MSYEWIRRRKNYLSVRYLFPEFVAPWIQFKRSLLRVMWFFTHPVDEFFEDVGELIAWPFVALATLFAWLLSRVVGFFKDLMDGIESSFRYLGRLPVWTGAAIAGTLGIIATILLFFLQVATFDPVPLSTAAAASRPPINESEPEQHPVWRPQPLLERRFDPFDGQPAQEAASPPHTWHAEAPQTVLGLTIGVERLSLPFDWDPRGRIDVASTAPPATAHDSWTEFERLNAMAGWTLTQIERAHKLLNFTPYVTRRDVHGSQVSPGWVTTAASVSPFVPVESRREPAVAISRTVPESATLGGTMQYELLVSNPGIEPLECVTVSEFVSAIDRVMDVDPPASVVDDTLVWNVTDLQPREQRRFSIELRPDRLMPVSGGSTVRVTTGVAAVSLIGEPTQPAPPITPEPPNELNVFLPEPQPEPAADPQPAPSQQFGMILPTFDEQPQFDPPPQPSEPELTFEPLPQRAPKPEPAIMPFMPVEPEVPSVAEFRATQNVEAARGSTGVPIFFEMRTPRMVTVRGAVATVFEIRNPGAGELTNLVLLVEVTGELDHERGRILEHRIERLAPGGVYRTRLTTTAVRNGLARVRSTLTSDEDLDSRLEAEIEVSSPGEPPTQLSAAELPIHDLPTSTQ